LNFVSEKVVDDFQVVTEGTYWRVEIEEERFNIQQWRDEHKVK
jgi:hypothetical protein